MLQAPVVAELVFPFKETNTVKIASFNINGIKTRTNAKTYCSQTRREMQTAINMWEFICRYAAKIFRQTCLTYASEIYDIGTEILLLQ